MQFKEVMIIEDEATYLVKKEVATKVIIESKTASFDNNRNLCVVDTGNGYLAHFHSFTNNKQDHYTFLDYDQAEYLMQAVAEFLGKEVVSKDEVPVRVGQVELVSKVAPEFYSAQR